MKLIFIILSALFTQANAYYADSEWEQAAEAYEQCLQDTTEGYLTDESRGEIYYNLGNARFKQGETAQAILAYERCLRLCPRHKDAKFNLEFAKTRIVDDIDDNRTFFLSSWAKTVRNQLKERTWSILSIVLFYLFLAGALLFALGGKVVIRKTAFHTAWICLLLSLLTGLNAHSLHQRDTKRSEAIITLGILNAKSSPDQSGTELFTLHEGTKVEIIEVLGEWCNIQVGNNEGWIETQHAERI